MKKKLMAVVMAFVLVQFGCEKEEVQTQVEEAEQATSETVIKGSKNPCSPANAANPYDNVGAMHNAMMDQIVSVIRPGDDINRVMEISDSTLIANYGADAAITLSTAADVAFFIEQIDADNYASQIDALNLSQLQRDKLNDLFTLSAAYDETNACQVIEQIIQFEADLMANYTTAQVEYVLIASSIMRHSMFYWDGFIKDKKFWKIFTVVVCDVAGGIAGGLAGGPTVVGNVIGAVVGGASASAGASVTYDYFEGG